jgi:hypothetical protein
MFIAWNCSADILNRQELVFMPLHEAGPAIKLVQSLTPMWEVSTYFLKVVRIYAYLTFGLG